MRTILNGLGIALLALVGGLSLGCSVVPKGKADLDVGVRERGMASWYGEAFHGWLTASGETYDMHALTGAHRKLPLGTVVRVTNVRNGKRVRIRINDRGPYVDGRILDLSYGAAKELGMVTEGVSPVQIEVTGYHLPVDLAWSEAWWAMWDGASGSPATTQEATKIATSWERTAIVAIQTPRQPTMRQAPVDVIRERRVRRVADILAAEQRVYAVAALLV